MEWATKEMVMLILGILGFLGQALKQYLSEKNNRKAVNDKIEKSGVSILEKLKESDASQTLRLDKIEKTNKSVKTMMDLRYFEKSFIRNFKRDNKALVEKLDINQNLKSFLKGGVSEIANIFHVIIEAQFLISDEEINAEILESKVSLSSKFKDKCANFPNFKGIIESELFTFIEFYQEVKILENGDRMAKFNTLCKKTTIQIILQIAKYDKRK